jgi:hypothetical protein
MTFEIAFISVNGSIFDYTTYGDFVKALSHRKSDNRFLCENIKPPHYFGTILKRLRWQLFFLLLWRYVLLLGNKQIICQGETIQENASSRYYNKIYTEC